MYKYNLKTARFVLCLIYIIFAHNINVYSFGIDNKDSGVANVKTVYITSDDGPWSGTENIIKVATATKTPISLFFIGYRYYKANDNLKQVVQQLKDNPYIQICNHSYSHAWGRYGKFYHTDKLAYEDFKKNTQELGISNASPIHSRFPARNVFRLPNLRKNDDYVTKHCKNPKQEEAIYDEVYDNGKYYVYGWDVYWDFNNKGKPLLTPKEIVSRINKKFKENTTVMPNKCILIMHDVMFMDKFSGKENLTNLIALLKKEGYRLDFIKNYIK